VRLTDLQRALSDVPRPDLDAALDRMYRDQRINLVPQADQQNLTAADRQSAIEMGGMSKHRISIEEAGPVSEEDRAARPAGDYRGPTSGR
jgi:hypothetical protein